MADFRQQLKIKRGTKEEEKIEARLDKAIGKELDATLVPNFASREPRETEEVFPNISELKLSYSDRVKFTSECETLASISEKQAALNLERMAALHQAKKIAHKYGISKVEVNGHRFRLWSI